MVTVLIVALTLQLRNNRNNPEATPTRQPTPDAAQLSTLRARAQLPPCPTSTGTGAAPLRNITVQCMADGSEVNAANVVDGRAVLLNMWAYWCAPCRTELPAMAEYQRRSPQITVVTVHEDDDAKAALQLLTDLDVRLPTLQDGARRIAAALRAPNVMPTTVLLRADGSVAATLPRAFASADEIAAAVDSTLGVRQ
jgi:thiol-disulfide isomerase/thioredoxin